MSVTVRVFFPAPDALTASRSFTPSGKGAVKEVVKFSLPKK
ncbi:MAG TPA: hypothetical protein VME70_05085 [Mycobacteriales bacterium]|nr:hypothetical protein [Mycobacteriales bacterium]